MYSGVFAAAATVDAGMKQKRREQWERAIAEVKEDLDQAGEHGIGSEQMQIKNRGRMETATAREKEEREGQGGGRGGRRGRGARGGEQEQDDVNGEAQALFEDPTLRRAMRYTPVWPTNSGPPLEQHNVPPQSDYAPEHVKEQAQWRPWTPKKLRNTELSVDRLVLRLFLHLDDMGQLKKAAMVTPASFHVLANAPRHELEAMLRHTEKQLYLLRRQADNWLSEPVPADENPDRIDVTKRIHSHSANYAQDHEGRFLSSAADLHSAIKDLIAKRQADPFITAVTLAKIAYNLSVSPAPPTLAIWNTILAHLTSQSVVATHASKKPAELVIDAVRQSHVRMNEDTMVHILNHYVATDKSLAFTKFVGAMRGKHGGLMLARPDINITDTGAPRLVRISADKVVQNPYPTPRVFEALIKGVLHFAGFDAAMAICMDMGYDGWGLSIRGLMPLLHDCVRRGDWEAGDAVWRQMGKLRDKSRREGRPERIPKPAYLDILRLAFSRGRDGVDVFKHLFADATSPHGGWSAEHLLNTVKEYPGPSVAPRRRLTDGPEDVAEKDEVVRQMVAERKRNSRAEAEAEVEAEDEAGPGPGPGPGVASNARSDRSETHADGNAKSSTAARSPDVDGTDTDAAASKGGRGYARNSGSLHNPARPWKSTTLRKEAPLLLERERLVGDIPAAYELPEYENRERTLSLGA